MIDCTPLDVSPQSIHYQETDKIISKKFICSFVYGFNTFVSRRDLWSSLISWGINSNEPWILMGDFNSTLSVEDRSTRIQIANSDMDDFVACTSTLGLEESFSMGSKFTCTNGSHWAKLDRVLTNSTWSSLHLNCQVEFLQYNTLSDHTPIVVSLDAQTPTRDKPFKFLNMLMLHPDFAAITRDSWHLPMLGTKQYIMCMKLKELKPKLKNLNRQHFSHITERTKRG